MKKNRNMKKNINMKENRNIRENTNTISYFNLPVKAHSFYNSPLQCSIFPLVYLDMCIDLYSRSCKTQKKLIFLIHILIFILMMVTVLSAYELHYDKINLWHDTVITTIINTISWIGENIKNFIYTKPIYAFLTIKLILISGASDILGKGNFKRIAGTFLVLIAEVYTYDKIKMYYDTDFFEKTFIFIMLINATFTCAILYSAFKFKTTKKVKMGILDKIKLIKNNPRLVLIILLFATIAFTVRWCLYTLLLVDTSVSYVDTILTVCFIVFPVIFISNLIIWLAGILINSRIYSPVNKFIESAYNFDITVVIIMTSIGYLIKPIFSLFFVICWLVTKISFFTGININTISNMINITGYPESAGPSSSNRQGPSEPGGGNRGNGGNGGPNSGLTDTTTDSEDTSCEEDVTRTPEYSRWGVNYMTPYSDPMYGWSLHSYLIWVTRANRNFTEITDADNISKDMPNYDIRLNSTRPRRSGITDYEGKNARFGVNNWYSRTKEVYSWNNKPRVIAGMRDNTPLFGYKSFIYESNDIHIDNIAREYSVKYRNSFPQISGGYLATNSITPHPVFQYIYLSGRDLLNQDFNIPCKILGSKFKKESGWTVKHMLGTNPEFKLNCYMECFNRDINRNIYESMKLPRRLHTIAVFARAEQSTSSIIEQLVEMARAHLVNSNCYLLGIKGKEAFAAIHVANWHKDHFIAKPDKFEGVLGIYADHREGVNILAQKANTLCPVVKYDLSQNWGCSGISMIINYMYASETVPHFSSNYGSVNLRELEHSHAPWPHSHKAIESNDELFLDQKGRMHRVLQEFSMRNRMRSAAQEMLNRTEIQRQARGRPWDL